MASRARRQQARVGERERARNARGLGLGRRRVRRAGAAVGTGSGRRRFRFFFKKKRLVDGDARGARGGVHVHVRRRGVRLLPSSALAQRGAAEGCQRGALRLCARVVRVVPFGTGSRRVARLRNARAHQPGEPRRGGIRAEGRGVVAAGGVPGERSRLVHALRSRAPRVRRAHRRVLSVARSVEVPVRFRRSRGPSRRRNERGARAHDVQRRGGARASARRVAGVRQRARQPLHRQGARLVQRLQPARVRHGDGPVPVPHHAQRHQTVRVGKQTGRPGDHRLDDRLVRRFLRSLRVARARWKRSAHAHLDGRRDGDAGGGVDGAKQPSTRGERVEVPKRLQVAPVVGRVLRKPRVRRHPQRRDRGVVRGKGHGATPKEQEPDG